jgi:hypothetical protein
VIFSRQDPPDPAREPLRSLRPSLNAPVLLVDELPAGPATAAIACVGDPAAVRVLLAIRAERTGQTVLYGPDAELAEWHGPEIAVEAALSFAESMGFLFDDDRAADAPDAARRLWAELLDAALRPPAGDAGSAPGAAAVEPARAQPAPEPEAPSEPLRAESDWLEEVFEEELRPARPLALTKFRPAASLAAWPTPRGAHPPGAGRAG